MNTRKLVFLFIAVVSIFGAALMTPAQDQQIASWTRNYKNTDDGGIFSGSSHPWTKSEYRLSVSNGNVILVEHNSNTDVTSTDTIPIGKIKEVDAGKGDPNDPTNDRYTIGITTYGDDITKRDETMMAQSNPAGQLWSSLGRILKLTTW